MGKLEKLLVRILSGGSDSNINFNLLCKLVVYLGFDERIKGDYFIYTKQDVDEIINLQPLGSKAKPYQVKQVRNIIVKYCLGEINAK